jgi:hypothetical protein
MTPYQIQLAIEREILPGRKPEAISAPERPEGGVLTSLQGIGAATAAIPAYFEKAVEEIRDELKSPVEKAREAARVRAFGPVAARSQAQMEAAKQQTNVQMAEPEFDTMLGRGLYSGTSSFIQNLPGTVASVIKETSIPALANIAAVTAPATYQKYRERGASVGEAALGTSLETGIELGTEALPLNRAVKILGKVGFGSFIKQYLGRELPSEAVATILQNAVDTAIANPDKTWADYVKELPNALGETAIATLVPTTVLAGASKVAQTLQREPRATAEEAPPEEPGAEAGAASRRPSPPPPPPADMGALARALGPVGGKVTLQEPSGPQEYTYQGLDEDGSVLLIDPDGNVFAEDPAQISAAMKVGAVEPKDGLGAVAFGGDVTEGLPPVRAEVVAEETPPAPAAAPPPEPPTSKIFQPSGQPAPEPTTAPPEIGLGTGSFEEYLAAARASKPAPPPSDTSNIFQPSGRPAPEPVRISMPPYVRPPEFKVRRPAPEAVAEPVAAPVAEPTPAPLPEAYAPILQEYQAIVEKPTPEATDRLKASTVREIPMQMLGSNMTMSVVSAPDGTLLALPGRNMIIGWQRQLQGELLKSLREVTIDQFYDYEGNNPPLQVTRPAVVDADGNVIQRGVLGKAPASRASAPAPTLTAAPAPAPAPAPAKPPRARKLPAPPKAATTMQAYIAQIAKTFKKGQDRYSFESAVDAGVDPDWLNSRADLRRMFGKEKLTRGRNGKVIQNQRQINENLKSFSDLAMGFQPKDWGLYGESLDENGYVLPAALADLINGDAPRYDPTTGRPYEQEAQEEDYGFEATVQAVSREASDLGVDLTDADMRAIAEKIGADGDPLQGIVDYVNEQFEEVMAEARDYSEYDAGQEEFPDGPVTNIEDSIAEPGVGGQAAAPGDAGQGQANREQPAGAAPQVEEGSLGLSAEQAAPQGGMTERQRAEMQARLQQSQMRRGNQEAFDQQEGGMFDASRDQDGLFKSVEAALPAAQAEALEEARKVPSLSRGVRKLLKQWGAGRIDDGMLASNVADLAEYIDYMKDGRNYRVAQRGRARGADRIMEVLFREKRKGNVSDETLDFMLWALKGNPNLAEGLAISTLTTKKEGVAGQYDDARRLIKLFKNRASDTTAVHEMLHHTERMMPPDVQTEIRKTWLREFNKAAEKGKSNAPINTFFQALRALHGRTKFTVGNETLGPNKGWDIAINLINQGLVPYSYYQYVNPSEFWAVNATEIMRKRFDVKDSTLARIRNWLSELAEKAKGLFNLSATSPLIKALDSLAKADGKFNSLTMLQESEGARYMSVSSLAGERAKRALDRARSVEAKGMRASIDDLENLIDELDGVYNNLPEGSDAQKDVDAASNRLENLLYRIEDARRPSNQNVAETEYERAYRETSAAEDAYYNLLQNEDDERRFMDRRTKARKEFEKEIDRLFDAKEAALKRLRDIIAKEQKTALKTMDTGTPAEMKDAIAAVQKPDDKVMNERANLQKQNRGCD